MSSSNSPCAACKFLRRKCTQECVLAPYFPPDQPHKFVNIHKVFGNSNVTKILNELPVSQREEAVNSLAYEAEARLSDPVYGCVGLISYLQQSLKKIQLELEAAKNELASYGGQAVLGPMLQNMYLHHQQQQQQHPNGCQFHHPGSFSGQPSFSGGGNGVQLPSNQNYLLQYNMAQMMGIPPGKGQMPSGINGLEMVELNHPQPLQTVHHQPNQNGVGQLVMRESNLLFNENSPNQNPNDNDHNNIIAAQQLVAEMQVKEEQELMRNLEQQQQQQQQQQTSPNLHQQQQAEQFLTFSGGGLHDSGPGLMMGGGSNSDHSSGITIGGGRFGQMVNNNNNSSHVVDMPPSLALGTGYDPGNSYHQEQQHHHDQAAAPLMLFHPMESQQQSPDLELNRSVIPQQFFQEQPGTIGGGRGFGESRNNSSTATSC